MAVVFTVLAVVAIFITTSAFAALGGSAANSGNLQTYKPSGGSLYGIQSEYQQAFGWNGTHWVKGTLATVGTDGITITFTDQGNITSVFLFTNNNTQDDSGLLQQSLIFTKTKMTTSLTQANSKTTPYANLTSAYLVMGSAHNSSATSSYADKGITNGYMNYTLYSSNVNHIDNKSYELPVTNMFMNLKGKPMYEFNLHSNIKVNDTGIFTITLYQEYEYPFAFNLEEVVYGVAAVIALVAVVPLYFSIPRRYGA